MVIVTLRITTACPIPTLNASISNPTAHLALLCSLTFLIFLHCVPVLRRMIFRHASLSQRQGALRHRCPCGSCQTADSTRIVFV